MRQHHPQPPRPHDLRVRKVLQDVLDRPFVRGFALGDLPRRESVDGLLECLVRTLQDMQWIALTEKVENGGRVGFFAFLFDLDAEFVKPTWSEPFEGTNAYSPYNRAA